jgi:DNA anti-recombination protein RmuC
MTTDERPPTGPVNGEQALGLLSLVLTQLGEVERRILHQMNENAKMAGSRWRGHEQEHQELISRLDRVANDLDRHLDGERDKQIAMEARMGPIRTLWSLVAREWRTIAIAALIVWQSVHEALGL